MQNNRRHTGNNAFTSLEIRSSQFSKRPLLLCECSNEFHALLHRFFVTRRM